MYFVEIGYIILSQYLNTHMRGWLSWWRNVLSLSFIFGGANTPMRTHLAERCRIDFVSGWTLLGNVSLAIKTKPHCLGRSFWNYWFAWHLYHTHAHTHTHLSAHCIIWKTTTYISYVYCKEMLNTGLWNDRFRWNRMATKHFTGGIPLVLPWNCMRLVWITYRLVDHL